MDYLDRPLRLNEREVLDVWDEVSTWCAHFGLRLLDRVPLRNGMRVLDVGCATGFPLLELVQMLGRGSMCVGIDPWVAALARAQRKVEVLQLPNADLINGDGARMPFCDGSFDLIVSNLGLNNFQDAEGVIRECGRVARVGATIAITTNPRGHMAQLYDDYRSVLDEQGDAEQLARLETHEAHRRGASEVMTMLANAGFGQPAAQEDVFSMRFVDGSALFRHSFMMRGFLDQWRAIAGAADERRLLAALEARLNERAEREGGLRLSVTALYLEAQKH